MARLPSELAVCLRLVRWPQRFRPDDRAGAIAGLVSLKSASLAFASSATGAVIGQVVVATVDLE